MPDKTIILIVVLCAVLAVLCAVFLLKKRKQGADVRPAAHETDPERKKETTEELLPEETALFAGSFTILRDITLVGSESVIPWDGSFE